MFGTMLSLIFLWLIGIMVLGIYNMFHAVRVKQVKHIVIAGTLLVVEYFFLQMISEIVHSGEKMNGKNHIWGMLFIAVITWVSITLASYFRHWKKQHITPMSVKDSMDMLHAGLCYWEDGGRIILSNKQMDDICFTLTGAPLLNGEYFYDNIEEECLKLPDGSIKLFLHSMVDFDDKQIHELVATDVTELYRKNELLEQKTLSLQKMNENLRIYNQQIEETIRKQEILDAKICIHDEMNRLMLLTTAMTETTIPEEDFVSVLTLWRNNAVLLGNEAETSQQGETGLEIDKLAKLLGIHVKWTNLTLGDAPKRLREILVMITREAIANAVKHADAKTITIHMSMTEKELAMGISNDGRKPDGKVKAGGGLSNIRRMIEAKKGCLEVAVKEQFVLNVKIPI